MAIEKCLKIKKTIRICILLMLLLRDLAKKSYWGGRLSTVDLLVTTNLDQRVFILKISFSFFTKQAVLMKGGCKAPWEEAWSRIHNTGRNKLACLSLTSLPILVLLNTLAYSTHLKVTKKEVLWIQPLTLYSKLIHTFKKHSLYRKSPF